MFGLAVLATCLGACLARAKAAVPEYTAVIVKTWPHDPGAFTEGLLYHNGFIYESTGLKGRSSIRQVMLQTGHIVRERDLDPRYYGEGIVIWKRRLIQLTWQDGIGFIYDLRTFRPLGSFGYPGQGWALTQDGSHLIMSDGTPDLRILDPGTLTERRRVHVTCEGRPVRSLNELEWVKGQIYANVWQTNLIVRIDPATGDTVGVIDLSDLAAKTVTRSVENVPNGIAYDAAADRLFVTGKLWPALYQIELSRRPDGQDPCQALP
jgi:glutaminyl-peptide cyclotransferase